MFIVLAMIGVIAGNIRGIALSTLVTVLIPEERRDRANGLVGMAMGVSFLVTSVISGLLVAAGDMFYVLLLAMGVLALAVVHLGPITVNDRMVRDADTAEPDDDHRVDLRGTVRLVRGVPGLLALIGFSCFNNFLGGAFMALMDAYGLSLMSVQAWGLLWGALSAGFIIGGLAVTRTGLGANPLRLLLLVNVVLWTVTILFPLRSSIIMLTVGMAVYMLLIPYAEASEQTILQRVVPYERQGRVFGFAQSVEMAASPLTAFLIGPLTQLIFIPFMTDGYGAESIGSWFGTGADRGIALVFVLTGVIGLIVTLLALRSRFYRRLSARYAESSQSLPAEPATASLSTQLGQPMVLPGQQRQHRKDPLGAADHPPGARIVPRGGVGGCGLVAGQQSAGDAGVAAHGGQELIRIRPRPEWWSVRLLAVARIELEDPHPVRGVRVSGGVARKRIGAIDQLGQPTPIPRLEGVDVVVEGVVERIDLHLLLTVPRRATTPW